MAPTQKTTSSSQAKAVVTLPPLFKAFLIINIVLCASCLRVMIWLSALATSEVPKMREDLYRACETVFEMTAGAFLGLLAGRGSKPDKVEPG